MAKKAEFDLTKHTLHLFEGDYAKIQDLFPDVGAAVVIRRLVRQYVERIEATQSSAPSVNVNI